MNAKLIVVGGLAFYAVTWILTFVTGLIYSCVLAALYGKVPSVFAGSGWMRGARYGFWIGLLATAIALSYSGFFNLPDRIWFWWAVEGLVGSVIGCAVLAWAVDRWAPANQW